MKSPAVLIAEDNEILRQDLKGLFIRHGFEVIEAPGQTHILPFFLDTKPDLVIIGSSPDNAWDQLKVAEQIRQRDRKVPLILITRHSSEARVIAALRAGVNDYFKMPFWNRDDSIGAKIRGEERTKDTVTVNFEPLNPEPVNAYGIGAISRWRGQQEAARSPLLNPG